MSDEPFKYRTADEVTGEARDALIDLLYRLADDDLIIGHRNSEWTGLAPILEADIAFSSIAQDQMGQALAYYRLLHDLGEPDPDTNAFLREPDQFRCASLVTLEKGDWAQSTVRLFFYETAKQLRIDHLVRSSHQPLAQLTRKMRGEQKYHSMHAEMWIKKLGPSTAESRSRMQAAVDALYPHGLGLFEPTEFDAVIAAEGFAPTEGDLCNQWRQQVDALLAGAQLTVPGADVSAATGRRGRPCAELTRLVQDMQKVFRLDPQASW